MFCHSERSSVLRSAEDGTKSRTCCLAGAGIKAGFSTPQDHPHTRMILLRFDFGDNPSEYEQRREAVWADSGGLFFFFVGGGVFLLR